MGCFSFGPCKQNTKKDNNDAEAYLPSGQTGTNNSNKKNKNKRNKKGKQETGLNSNIDHENSMLLSSPSVNHKERQNISSTTPKNTNLTNTVVTNETKSVKQSPVKKINVMKQKTDVFKQGEIEQDSSKINLTVLTTKNEKNQSATEPEKKLLVKPLTNSSRSSQQPLQDSFTSKFKSTIEKAPVAKVMSVTEVENEEIVMQSKSQHSYNYNQTYAEACSSKSAMSKSTTIATSAAKKICFPPAEALKSSNVQIPQSNELVSETTLNQPLVSTLEKLPGYKQYNLPKKTFLLEQDKLKIASNYSEPANLLESTNEHGVYSVVKEASVPQKNQSNKRIEFLFGNLSQEVNTSTSTSSFLISTSKNNFSSDLEEYPRERTSINFAKSLLHDHYERSNSILKKNDTIFERKIDKEFESTSVPLEATVASLNKSMLQSEIKADGFSLRQKATKIKIDVLEYPSLPNHQHENTSKNNLLDNQKYPIQVLGAGSSPKEEAKSMLNNEQEEIEEKSSHVPTVEIKTELDLLNSLHEPQTTSFEKIGIKTNIVLSEHVSNNNIKETVPFDDKKANSNANQVANNLELSENNANIAENKYESVQTMGSDFSTNQGEEANNNIALDDQNVNVNIPTSLSSPFDDVVSANEINDTNSTIQKKENENDTLFNSVLDKLEAIRKKAQPFEQEIEQFTELENSNKYYYIEESLRRLVDKLDDLYDDICNNEVLKRRRKEVYKCLFSLFDKLDEKVKINQENQK